MRKEIRKPDHCMAGLEHRSALQQASVNIDNAIRAADLVPRLASDLCPHPLDIVLAEIRNAQRYIEAHQNA